MNTKTDLELVALLQNESSDEAFLEIMNRYSQKVFNLAMRLTRNSEDAEEIIQDVFVSVHKKISSFEGKSAFSSWLYRITANTAFMKLRKRKNTEVVSFEDVSPAVKESWSGVTPDESDKEFMSVRHELRSVLEYAVSRLPEEYKTIFVLRDIDGHSNEEVGELLGVSVPAVKSRLHRARMILRKKLQRYYDDYTKSDYMSFGKNMTRDLYSRMV